MSFAQVIYVIFEWLIVLALLGLIGVIGWLVMTVLEIKTRVMKDAKRLYESPTRSVKSLIATGKGIAQQESVRVRHIGGSVKVAATSVKAASGEVKVAAQSIHVSELKSSLADVQNVMKFVSLIGKFSKSVTGRGSA